MSRSPAPKKAFAREAKSTARQERAIQKKIDKIDAKAGTTKDEPMQAGAREYPVHFPKQHLRKPGLEADLQQAPMFDAPHYKGSDKLKGKVALITGGDSGIGRSVAVLYAREGADVAIAYLDESEDVEVTKEAVEAEGQRCITFAGDVADFNFCEAAVKATVKAFGRLDILVNNAAFQEHVQNFEDCLKNTSTEP
jgi:hypothetical protein